MHKGKIDDNYLGSGIRIINSIKKYGRENHNREILEILEDDLSMRLREEEIIDENLLLDPLCLNLIKGGRGGWAYLRGINPERYKEQINKGVETRKREGTTKRSDACKKIMSQKATGRKMSETCAKILWGKTRKSIIQSDLFGIFIKRWDSLRECSKTLGISHSSIIYAIKNKDGLYKGFIWSYSG